MPTRFGVSAMSAGRAWIVNEECEGTGTPSGWTNANGSPNWDYTATVLEGTQSVLLATNGVAVAARPTDFTNVSEIYVYFMLQVVGAFPGSNQSIITLQPNGGGSSFVVSITPTGRISWTMGGQNVSPVTAISLSTTIHVWMHYVAGTGANGFHSLGYSTTGVRPASGGTYGSNNVTTATAVIGRVLIGNTATTSTFDIIMDRIRVATLPINDFGI